MTSSERRALRFENGTAQPQTSEAEGPPELHVHDTCEPMTYSSPQAARVIGLSERESELLRHLVADRVVPESTGVP
jgi:hypothetical protein